MSEDRFVEIETKLSHQEFLIEKLNNVITDQQAIIEVLEAKLKVLIDRLKEIGPPAGEIRGHEKPPHY